MLPNTYVSRREATKEMEALKAKWEAEVETVILPEIEKVKADVAAAVKLMESASKNEKNNVNGLTALLKTRSTLLREQASTTISSIEARIFLTEQAYANSLQDLRDTKIASKAADKGLMGLNENPIRTAANIKYVFTAPELKDTHAKGHSLLTEKSYQNRVAPGNALNRYINEIEGSRRQITVSLQKLEAQRVLELNNFLQIATNNKLDDLASEIKKAKMVGSEKKLGFTGVDQAKEKNPEKEKTLKSPRRDRERRSNHLEINPNRFPDQNYKKQLNLTFSGVDQAKEKNPESESELPKTPRR